MTYLLLHVGYPRHRKVLRLVKLLGPIAELYPIRLWLWGKEHSPTGSLRDLSPEEIAGVTGYTGDPAELWKALVACGIVETVDGERRLRSWDEHNGAKPVKAKRAKPESLALAPDPDFERLWTICANKRGRGQAEITFRKLKALGVLPPIDELCAALEDRQTWHDWTKPDRETGAPRGYMPHLSSALNNKFWTDEPPAIYRRPVKPVSPIRAEDLEEFRAIHSSRWDAIRERLRLQIPPVLFERQVAPLVPVSEDANGIVVAAPSFALRLEVEEDLRNIFDRETRLLFDPLFQLTVTAGRIVQDERRTA